MNKKIILLLLLSGFLFSCSLNENLNLSHHFSNKWSYDQTYHFFRCLDEGCDAVREKHMHFLADRVCEVCGYDVKWDNLNGGGEGEEIQEISKISESDYLIDDFYSYSEKSFDLSVACKIDLSSLINDIDHGSYSFKNNILKIKVSGIYELSGYLKG